MAAFQNVDPTLGVYFKKHAIPDIYEALLCGLLIMCPDDPLRFLEEKLKEIMEKGLYSILWNMCIDPALSQRLKVISETYLHTLLGLDDDQLMTTELCDKAWDFYSTKLKRMCFDAWIKYCSMKKITEEMLQKKLYFAQHFYENKLLKKVVKKWNSYVHLHKEQQEGAAQRIGKVFHCTLQKIILMSWKKETRFTRKAKRFVEHVEGKAEEPLFVERPHVEGHERRHSEKRPSIKRRIQETILLLRLKSGKDHMTKLPERAIAQVFHYLTLIDLGRCAQVNQAWRAITQMTSIWSNINFSAVKDVVSDNIAGNILLKWRTSVVHLNLRGCATLHWHTFKNIGQCKNLQELNVSECQVLNISVEGFRNIAYSCSGIQRLTINEMPTLTDRCIQALAEKCKQIVSVEFNESPHVSDAGFKALAQCELIKMKIEGSNRITDLSFKLMSKFWPHMKCIGVPDCQKITDVGLKLIAPLDDIAVLNLSDCMRISDGGIKSFVDGSSGSRIRELSLANCSYVTDSALIKIAQRCPNLIYLNLRYCQAVTDAGIETLVLISSLAYLNISGLDITDQALETLSKQWRMKEITISECKHISDTGIKKFCVDLRKLEYIDFSHCDQLSNNSLKHLTFNCHGITSLSMAGCTKITDIGIQFVAAACTYLHYLDISGCINITDKGLKCLWKGCLQLRILKMLYCTNITRQAVLKHVSKLQKYEYSDDDPPLWFRNTSSVSSTLKKQKKPRHGIAIRQQSNVTLPEGKSLESRSPSTAEPPAKESLESSRPSPVGPPAEN